mmetsp:Transcript_26450/g.47799  ORF Transcript_26450/g.47799 Transcript_26450/m.47799 type:complete len:89 (+) Transcript_26450:215-481(+)
MECVSNEKLKWILCSKPFGTSLRADSSSPSLDLREHQIKQGVGQDEASKKTRWMCSTLLSCGKMQACEVSKETSCHWSLSINRFGCSK